MLGAVLLAIVFFVPDGLIGLLRSARARMGKDRLSGLLHGLAERIGGNAPDNPRRPPASASNDSAGRAAPLEPSGKADRRAQT